MIENYLFFVVVYTGFYGGKAGASNYFSDKSLLGLTYHRMVEAFKFGFGQRGNLADSSFVNVNDVRTIYNALNEVPIRKPVKCSNIIECL